MTVGQTTILRPVAVVGSTLTEADGSNFTFDATLNESVQDTFDVTQHPVEEGADVTDHVQKKPSTLQLQVAVTNSPLPEQAAPAQNRDIALYDSLRVIADKREPLTVVTGLRVYLNMVISSLSTTRNPQTGQILVMDLDLTEVILTTTQTVDIPADLQRKRGGRQNPQAIAEGAAATSTSIAVAGAGANAAADPEAKATDEKQTSRLAERYG